MKRIKEYRTLLLFYAGMGLILLFAGYGNKKVHPDLNRMMLDKFLNRNNKGQFSQKDFVHYTFFFDKGVVLKGIDIIKDGLFSATDVAAAGWGYNYSEEGSASRTPGDWIVRGGFTADVPEVPASLRHFYDPTQKPGNRYLTDIANATIMGSLQKYALTNPHIDGVEWAIGKPGDFSIDAQSHLYTWERGKRWINMALVEKDKDKRDEFMAKAWRSLGETLHMIADNGCPSHVRNDAHPSPLYNNNTWFGNPDPYEELVDMIRNSDPALFADFAAGSPDPGFISSITGLKKAEKIAHELAVFTNKNFVTNETISGTNRFGKRISQLTHPSAPYSAPLLQHLTYESADFAYVSPNGVWQCTDRYYFADVVPALCDPYVDVECVISQAKALFPNIVEAGSRVIELYIPKIKVQLDPVSGSRISGSVKHTKDQEYTDEIFYEGPVKIQVKDKKEKIVKEIDVVARKGKFNGSFDPALFKEGSITAYIDFGGIRVQSADVRIKVQEEPAEPKKPVSSGPVISRILIYVESQFDGTFNCGNYVIDDRSWLDLESYNISISSIPGSFKGYQKIGNYYVEVSGKATEDELIEMRYKGKGSLGCREQEWEIVIKNIPRINQGIGDDDNLLYQLRPYEDFKHTGVDMSAHVSMMKLKEVNIENRSQTRNLIQTGWNTQIVGSSVPVSPLNQQSAISVSIYR
ncbi:MAG: hypothetical protein JNL22_13885 [Bacteroidales bacterium]|jgi:hypothetical protein|nr:hypothetical protein [Bacteroidales bacterium]